MLESFSRTPGATPDCRIHGETLQRFLMFTGEEAHPGMAAVKAPTMLGWWLQGTHSRARISPIHPAPARKILLHNPEHKERFMSKLTGCPSERCLSGSPRVESPCRGHCLNAKGLSGRSGTALALPLLPGSTDPTVHPEAEPSPSRVDAPPQAPPKLPPADASPDSRRLRQAGAAEEAGRTKRSGLANLFSSF